MAASSLILLGNLLIDGYQIYLQQGMSKEMAKARAIADGLDRYNSGHADWKNALGVPIEQPAGIVRPSGMSSAGVGAQTSQDDRMVPRFARKEDDLK